VVPLGDLAEEDISEHFTGESKLGIARQIVGGDISAQHGWNMKYLRRWLLELFVIHGAVAGPEIDGALRDLSDAAATADRLVVVPNRWIHLGVFTEPLVMDRIWESCCGTVHQHLSMGRA